MSNVETTDSFLSQVRRLMFRGPVPDDYAPVFRSDDVDHHSLHVVLVPFDIDAFWPVGNEVTKKERLSVWTSIGSGMADIVVELPASAADGVRPGDPVKIAERLDGLEATLVQHGPRRGTNFCWNHLSYPFIDKCVQLLYRNLPHRRRIE